MQPRRPHGQICRGRSSSVRGQAAGCGPIRRRSTWRPPAPAVDDDAAAHAGAQDHAEDDLARRQLHRRPPRRARSNWRRWRRRTGRPSRRRKIARRSGSPFSQRRIGVRNEAASSARSPRHADADAAAAPGLALDFGHQVGDRAQRCVHSPRRASDAAGGATTRPLPSSAAASILVPPRSTPRRNAGHAGSGCSDVTGINASAAVSLIERRYRMVPVKDACRATGPTSAVGDTLVALVAGEAESM